MVSGQSCTCHTTLQPGLKPGLLTPETSALTMRPPFLPRNMNLENYFTLPVTSRFYATCEKLELLTDIRDFTTLFYVILRCKSSKYLESSINSGLDIKDNLVLSTELTM